MKRPVYDIFLSHSARDQDLSKFIREEIQHSGLSVFSITDIGAEKSIDKAVREALVDSLAFVLVITPSTVHSPNPAVEMGMALAWSKPIFGLLSGVEIHELPGYLQSIQLHPISKLEQVIKLITDSRRELQEADREILGQVYSMTGISADRLLLQPAALDELTSEFNRRSKSKFSAQQLAHELIRMRKQGKLPRLKSVANSA